MYMDWKEIEIEELNEQVKRYEEALKHYADKSKYEYKYDHNLGYQVSEMTFDEGIIARRALGIEELIKGVAE